MSDIHHSSHSHTLQQDPSLANHDTSDEEVKGDSDTLSSNDTTSKALTGNGSTSKATTDNRHLDYDDASREYLATRGHTMSGSNKRHPSSIYQLIEEVKEVTP